MNTVKPIAVRGQPIAGGKVPLICTPLVGRSAEQLQTELDQILPKQPDVLEWRVDYFQTISDTSAVLFALAAIKKRAPGIPLLFTRRSTLEGGERISLHEDQVLALYDAVCQSGQIDLLDYEMANDPGNVARVRASAKAHGVTLVLSFHNFSYTPGVEALEHKFLQAEQLGADVAKVAVMPRNLDDVLALLGATHAASKKARIPLISMAMGPLGAVTRTAGWMFGSALTFAVGASASAPGQIPVEELNAVLAVLQGAMKPR
jgi:3-dehydroquinate dehydratase-1